MRMPPWNNTRPWISASTASKSYNIKISVNFGFIF